MIKRLIILLLLTATAFATVTDTTTKRQYFQPNDSITTFTFTMPGNSADDFKVEKVLTSTGKSTKLTEDTDYTIAATNSDYVFGGVVTIDPALAGTYDLTITRQIVLTQELGSGAVTHNTIEDALDKVTRQIQDQRNDISGRVLRIPDSDPTTAYEPLTDYVSRKGYWLGFDSSTGAPLVGTPAATGITVSSFMAGVNEASSAPLAMAKLQGIPVFNVKNAAYGAVGDGNADDTTAISDAITACNTAGGGIVWFPKGTYNMTGSTAILANVTLKGNNATIFVLANSDVDLFTIAASNIIIDGLEIDGNDGNQGADIDIFETSGTVDNLTIKNCHIHDVRSRVFKNGATLTNFKWIDNWTHDITSSTMSFSGTAASDTVLIARNTFTDATRAAAFAHTGQTIGHTNIKIINNTVKDMDTSEGFAFEVQDSDAVEISNNTINTTWRGIGVQFEGAGHVLVSNNTIIGATNWGIESSCMNAAGSVLIEGNNLYDCLGGITTGGNAGISISYNMDVKNNLLVDCSNGSTVPAINFAAVIVGSVSNNTIFIDDADSRGGIDIIWFDATTQSEDITCQGNNIFFSDTARTASPSGIFVGGVDRLKVSNNLISVGDDSGTSGLINLNSYTKNDIQVTNNTIIYRGGSQSSNYGIALNSTDSTDVYIKDNIIENTAVAIHTSTNTDEVVTIIGNLFNDNTTDITPHASHIVEPGAKTIRVELSATNIKALNGTPIELVPAQGADTLVEFVSAILIYDSTATAFDGVHNDEDLVIEYEDGDDVSQEIEVTGFLDQTNDEIRRVDSLVTADPSTDDLYDNVNDALELYMKTGEIITGTGTMTIHITYRVHYLGL